MMLVMTAFEFARLLYTWNALTEATRRGARMAVVCPVDGTAASIIRNVAVFNALNSAATSSGLLNSLDTSNIDINYLDGSGSPATTVANTNFVQVSITGYQFNFLIPYLSQVMNSPSFMTTLPVESKGAVPTPVGETAVTTPQCSF